MKRIHFIVIALIISFLPVYAAAEPLGNMRISLLDGDVQMKPAETEEWVPAGINTPLRAGDRIWVPEGGRLEVQLRGGTYVRLNEKTAMDILREEKNAFQFFVNGGQVYVNYRGGRGSFIQFDTPIASSYAREGSVYRIDVDETGPTSISVFRGAVNAENKGGRSLVNSGKSILIRDEMSAEVYPLSAADDWEMWNVDRDKRIPARYATRYIPPELADYGPELDENGRWVYVRDYGNVWTPTVDIGVEWSPYRSGRWVWRGDDYIWVGYEPWGWAPYHYGRWAFADSVGWFWVPPVGGAVYWGPGFVGWVQTPAYVSWVPLAPGEIYYGHGYYGPNSVNVSITSVNVTNVVYRNARVGNGFIVTNPDCFTVGRCSKVRVDGNPFLVNRINVGRPLLTPQRASFASVIKNIPAAKLPPQTVRSFTTSNLLQSRPMATGRTASVFNPASPNKRLPLNTFNQPRSTLFGTGTGQTGGQTGTRGEKAGGSPFDKVNKGGTAGGQTGGQTGTRGEKAGGSPVDKLKKEGTAGDRTGGQTGGHTSGQTGVQSGTRGEKAVRTPVDKTKEGGTQGGQKGEKEEQKGQNPSVR